MSPVQPPDLELFLNLENRLAGLITRRLDAYLAAHEDKLKLAVAAGDALTVSQILAAAGEVSWTPRELQTIRFVCDMAARAGAGSHSDAAVETWLVPSEHKQGILTDASAQFVMMARVYIAEAIAEAAAGVIDRALRVQKGEEPAEDAIAYWTVSNNVLKPVYETVEKADLVPKDFGYTPTSKAPPWRAAEAAIKGQGKVTSTLAANLTVSRLVNYGALDGMNAEGVREYYLRAKLDERTSAICRAMNGRKFEVREAVQLLERAFKVTNPADLKSVHPWISGSKASLAELPALSNKDLKARGHMVPPFHPLCRTVVVAARSTVRAPAPLVTPNEVLGGALKPLNAALEVAPAPAQFEKSDVWTFGSGKIPRGSILIDSPIPNVPDESNPLTVLGPLRSEPFEKVAAVTKVPVKELYTWQGGLEPERLRPIAEDVPPIHVGKINGRLVIMNGNHRASAAFAEGRETVDAYVVDFDQTQNRKYWVKDAPIVAVDPVEVSPLQPVAVTKSEDAIFAQISAAARGVRKSSRGAVAEEAPPQD